MRTFALAVMTAALLSATPLHADQVMGSGGRDGGQTVGSGGVTPTPPGGLIGSGTAVTTFRNVDLRTMLRLVLMLR